MFLGKRPRPPMKRTTSFSKITFDTDETVAANNTQQVDHLTNPFNVTGLQKQAGVEDGGDRGGLNGVDQWLLSIVSPRNNHRGHSANFLETPYFLRTCCLCKRRLVPGRDIYMYRGDSAFCSLECRQQQMNQDERKDKCSYASAKKQAAATSTATGSQVSAHGTETVAAV